MITPYSVARSANITAQWHLGHWPGHVRLLTPWRVFGVTWSEPFSIYVEPRDWWIGYYRGDTHNYVCPLPCVVIRWRRRAATPTEQEGQQ